MEHGNLLELWRTAGNATDHSGETSAAASQLVSGNTRRTIYYCRVCESKEARI